MNDLNLTRLHDWLHAHGCAGALLSSPFTLTWLTGYAPPIEFGPDPFLGGPALAWVHDGRVTVIASDAEAPALRAAGVDVREYAGYTVDQPLACATRMAAEVRAALSDVVHLSGAVAVEENALSATLLHAAHAALPQARWAPSDDALAALRAVKTDAEVARIRAALALCDAAQRHVRETLRAGITELDLWASMRAAVENAAGGRVPMLADLASGLRCADIGGPPTARVLQPGDGVIFDFVPRLDGVWGDCCDTLFVGEPSPELRRLRQVSLDALRAGVAAVRPGVRAGDLDALLRRSVRDTGYEPYPHHSGHGIGAAYHEAPRIVPGDSTILQAGMVIALEPGVYVPGLGGARVEDVVLVTHDGCEVLTQHLHY